MRTRDTGKVPDIRKQVQQRIEENRTRLLELRKQMETQQQIQPQYDDDDNDNHNDREITAEEFLQDDVLVSALYDTLNSNDSSSDDHVKRAVALALLTPRPQHHRIRNFKSPLATVSYSAPPTPSLPSLPIFPHQSLPQPLPRPLPSVRVPSPTPPTLPPSPVPRQNILYASKSSLDTLHTEINQLKTRFQSLEMDTNNTNSTTDARLRMMECSIDDIFEQFSSLKQTIKQLERVKLTHT
jgi:hypothetical protein